MIIDSIVDSLVKGKQHLWDFKFPVKVLNRQTQLGGLGDKALTIKLKTSSKYPNLEVKGFLNWKDFDKFTKEEKDLVNYLLDELQAH